MTDIDDCASHPCFNNGSCLDAVNTYSCNCLEGFNGSRCEISKFPRCTDVRCICIYPHNHPIKNISLDNFIRTFLYLGFLPDLSSANLKIKCSGEYLTDMDDCVNHTCANGGSCMDGVNTYTCNCPPGFTGMYCEKGKVSNTLTPLTLILQRI